MRCECCCVEFSRAGGEWFGDGQGAQQNAPSAWLVCAGLFLSYGGYSWLNGSTPQGVSWRKHLVFMDIVDFVSVKTSF
jgi:hypothetical protein